MNMKYNFVLKEIKNLLLILVISMLLTLTKLDNIISIYFPKIPAVIYIFISIVVFYYLVKSVLNKKYINYLIISYTLFLIMVLFFRNNNDNNIETNFYLFQWLKVMFINRTVFINILGNILIFIPLGLILKYFIRSTLISIIIGIGIIIMLELIQFITLVGIFDITDVILNLIGIVVGIYDGGKVYGRTKQK